MTAPDVVLLCQSHTNNFFSLASIVLVLIIQNVTTSLSQLSSDTAKNLNTEGAFCLTPCQNQTCKWGNTLIQDDGSLSEVMTEMVLVSIYVVCVCCACGAAFNDAYRGFAYSAKSRNSYRSHFVISNTVIADFQASFPLIGQLFLLSVEFILTSFLNLEPPHLLTDTQEIPTGIQRPTPVCPLFMPRLKRKSLEHRKKKFITASTVSQKPCYIKLLHESIIKRM